MATQTITEMEVMNQLDSVVRKEAEKALNKKEFSSTWAGVDWFIDWVRDKVRNFFSAQIAKLPIVGEWAARIGTTVCEFVFSVLQTCLSFLRIVLESPALWSAMHDASLKAWNANSDRGLLAQTYAYRKKMASYFLEILMQCFERAIRAKNLNVSAEEKKEISSVLDDLLK